MCGEDRGVRMTFFNHELTMAVRDQIQTPLAVHLPADLQVLFEKVQIEYAKKDNDKEGLFYRVAKRPSMNNAYNLRNLMTSGVQHSLQGAYADLHMFHSYCSWIEETARNISSTIQIDQPVGIFVPETRLIFVYENFMVRLRMILDRINQFLTYYFLIDARNVYRFYTAAEKKNRDLTREDSERLEKVLACINGGRHILDEHISTDKGTRKTERDTIAHNREITITVPSLFFYPNGECHVIFPDMRHPSNTNLLELPPAEAILEQRFSDMGSFTVDLVNSLFGFN